MKVIRSESKICVQSEYNPDLPVQAKKLGGKWSADSKCWSFDIRDEARVADLYRGIYGEWDTDGKPPADAVTVQFEAADEMSEWQGGIFFAGRQVARATGRDSGAKLGGGVVLLQGDINSGGSVKNWRTKISGGSVFEMKDVPVSKVEEERVNSDWKNIVIVSGIDNSALIAEREALIKRLAEIDAILEVK